MSSRIPALVLPAVACAASLGLSVHASAQATAVVQEKFFFNENQTDSTTRATSNAVDTIYFMQPAEFRTGYGTLQGFSAVLQDEDYNTAETVGFGAIRYGQNGMPDTSAAGVIVAGSLSLQFPQPASGTRSATLWRITLNTPAPIPAEIGLRLVLPAPASAADGVSVHTQQGTTNKLTQALRKQWTYSLSGTNAVQYFSVGTTLRYGGVYTEPLTQVFTESTLYGAAEDLYGPEALHPNPASGDKVGWRFRGAAFANQFAVLLIDGQIRQTPITTSFGTLFLQVPFGLIQLPTVLDATGEGKTPTVLPPAKIVLRTQSVFLHLGTGAMRSSDMAGLDAQ